MVESFKGLDNILRDWARDKIKKVFWRNSTSTTSIKKSFLENDLEKNNRVLSVGSGARNVGIQINFKVRNRCFVSNVIRTKKTKFLDINYFKYSKSQINC